ncbi:MAG: mannosyltransferase family protein [Candidatus Ventricola sp.]
MDDSLMRTLETAAAALSLLLMGACGVGLLVRLVRVLRGQETADGLTQRRKTAPASALLAAAGIGLLSRLALYLLAYVMYRLLGVGSDGLITSLAPLWTHWDTRHYLGIAAEGYTAVGDERLRLVFFPLYPLLMRLLSPLTGGNLLYAGMLVSLLCSAAASAMVYDLSHLHFGRETARRSVAYFLLSPLSVFLCCAYTEALFICLTLAAACLLRRGHPWLAALCGALSALTRMPGVIAAGLFIVAYLGKIPQKRANARALISCAGQVLLVFSGLFVYWIINWWVTGDPLMYMTYQRENWFQQPGAFWDSTANTVHYFLTSVGESDWLWTWGFQLLCMLGIYLLLAFGAARIPFDLAAYSFVYTAVVLSPTWLLSGARYLYALCALPMLLARMRIERTGHGLLLALSGALLVVWTFGYTLAIQVL